LTPSRFTLGYEALIIKTFLSLLSLLRGVSMKSALFAVTSATLSVGMMGIAQAGTIVVPDSVSTTMGAFIPSVYSVEN
jgi:hypothetical protein